MNGVARLKRSMGCLVADDRAATAAEYAILASFIALVLVASAKAFGISLRSPFQSLSKTVTPKK